MQSCLLCFNDCIVWFFSFFDVWFAFFEGELHLFEWNNFLAKGEVSVVDWYHNLLEMFIVFTQLKLHLIKCFANKIRACNRVGGRRIRDCLVFWLLNDLLFCLRNRYCRSLSWFVWWHFCLNLSWHSSLLWLLLWLLAKFGSERRYSCCRSWRCCRSFKLWSIGFGLLIGRDLSHLRCKRW